MTAEVQDNITRCPACQARIACPNILLPGDFVYCQECGRRLEVVSTIPMILDWETAEWDKPYADRY